jgi:hypothetical protein
VKEFLGNFVLGIMIGLALIGAYVVGEKYNGCPVVHTTDSPHGVLDNGGVPLQYDGHAWSYVANDGKHIVGYSSVEDSIIYNYERCIK